jgi:hypothetical protein
LDTHIDSLHPCGDKFTQDANTRSVNGFLRRENEKWQTNLVTVLMGKTD